MVVAIFMVAKIIGINSVVNTLIILAFINLLEPVGTLMPVEVNLVKMVPTFLYEWSGISDNKYYIYI